MGRYRPDPEIIKGTFEGGLAYWVEQHEKQRNGHHDGPLTIEDLAGQHRSKNVRRDILDLRQVHKLADREIEYLVPGLISPEEKIAIVGPQKAFKTWIALNLAHAVATGGVFLGHAAWKVEEATPVLFIEEEGTRTKFARRVRRFFKGEEAPFHLAFKPGISLLVEEDVDWVIAQAKDVSARLVILDPWQRLTSGVNEDKAGETGPAWAAVHRIAAETGAAVVVLHHAKKNGDLSWDAARGSSRFGGEVDAEVVIRKKKDTNIIEAFMDGRDIEKADGDSDTFTIEYDREDPTNMKVSEFRVVIKEKDGLKVVDAVDQYMDASEGIVEGTTVRNAVSVAVRRKVTNEAVNSRLRELRDQGKVKEWDYGRGKSKGYEKVMSIW